MLHSKEREIIGPRRRARQNPNETPKRKIIMKISILLIAAAAFLHSAIAQPVPQQKYENFGYYEALKEKYLGKQITLYVSHVDRHIDDTDGMPVFRASSFSSDGDLSTFNVRVPKEKVEEFVKRYGTEKRRSLYERIPELVVVGDEFTMPMKGELVEYKSYSSSAPECRLQVYPSTKPGPLPTPKPKATPVAANERLPKFLIAQNLAGDRDFVLHCQPPRFLWELSTEEFFALDPVPEGLQAGLMQEVKEFVQRVSQDQ